LVNIVVSRSNLEVFLLIICLQCNIISANVNALGASIICKGYLPSFNGLRRTHDHLLLALGAIQG